MGTSLRLVALMALCLAWFRPVLSGAEWPPEIFARFKALSDLCVVPDLSKADQDLIRSGIADTDERINFGAALALGSHKELRSRMEPELGERFQAADFSHRLFLARTWRDGHLPDAVTDAIRSDLASSDHEHVKLALALILNQPYCGIGVFRELRVMASDTADGHTRGTAIMAVGKVARDPEYIVDRNGIEEIFAGGLEQKDEFVRVPSMVGAGLCIPIATEAQRPVFITLLQRGLDDSSPYVRLSAISDWYKLGRTVDDRDARLLSIVKQGDASLAKSFFEDLEPVDPDGKIRKELVSAHRQELSADAIAAYDAWISASAAKK